jgi:NAD(P)-dependent dehydrogenase (short-subunit alcohol dehydrogenase family)
MNGPSTAIVTGGTRGIGAGIARALADASYRVIATGLSSDEVESFPETRGISARRLDVTDERSVAALFDGLQELHALVNCAGTILRDGAEFRIESFQKVIDVNLVGTMRMCLAARPFLARSRGSIVNMASMLSFFGGPAVPAYSASKGGITQLTKSLAGAWAAEGVRVNAVAPGWIDTELTRPLVENAERSRAILSRTPMGRWGAPDDLGGAVVFLSSEAARFITGVTLPVDGGYLAL